MDATKNSFGVAITDVTRLLRKHFDRRAAKYGLTRAQWRAMKRVSMHPGLRQAELAEMLELEPIAISRVLDRLGEAGYIERRADPDDRRARRLYVTAKAQGIVDQLQALSDGLLRDAFRGLKNADIAELHESLEHIKGNLIALDGPEK